MNTHLLAHTAIALTVLLLIGWFWQRKSQNAGIADVLWAYGLGGSAFYYAVMVQGALLPRVLAGLLATLWFARLGTHIFNRVMSESEDGRYQAMRGYFGENINVFHFFFFLAQAFMAWLFALPVWIAAHSQDQAISLPLILGVVVAIIAFTGECVADRQLSSFRSNPANRGKTCRQGLWRYSRHPNYFFEWLHWFAYPLFAWHAPLGIWVWLAPVFMLLFLYFITGIPYTERQALRSRGEDYRDYQRTTSAFIPWRPKI